ncbi:hypothetical protein RN001_015610 [Aquatica leii]|uniref:RING-type E3 ubiquitin transferase n=1 Tax=Aquatica leii TaxID=1421715 RepID=A0AAN7S5R2_9COLE|nr:hypothetical protein RN001_015610 [Aquatica leii]
MDLLDSSNEQTSTHSSLEVVEDVLSPEANKSVLPSCFDLEKSEINKLFIIISEIDTETLNEIMIDDALADVQRRYRVRPRRSLDLIFPRLAQISQSLNESTYNWPNTARRNDQLKSTTLIRYPEAFRLKIIRNVIAFIDSYSIRTLSKEEDLTDKCVICVCHFDLNDKMRTLNCSHKFHRFCIDEWLVESYNCPVCRTDLMGPGKVYTGLAYLYRSNTWRNERSEISSLPLSDTATTTNILNNNSDEDELLEVD